MHEKISSEVSILSNHFNKEKKYWLEKLSGDLDQSNFPYDFNNTDSDKYNAENVKFEIIGDDFLKLNKLSNKSHIKQYMILSTILTILLSKYTNNENILIGTPVPEDESIEGETINSILVLRNHIEKDMTFRELLLQVRQSIIEAVENQNYPFELLEYQLKENHNLKNDFILFDTMIVFENLHGKNALEYYKPNVIFNFSSTDEKIEGTVEYNTTLYKRETIERIAEHFENILHKGLNDVEILMPHIDIITQKEKEKILFEFNNTVTEYPIEERIHQLFEKQVNLTPEATAVIFEEESLTYKQLDEKSNQIANYLFSEKKIQPNECIGILLNRSISVIVAILGILKSGGAYVPIDPQLPLQRMKHIINDAKMKVLISEKEHTSSLKELQCECEMLHTYLCMNSTNISIDDKNNSNKDNKKMKNKYQDDLTILHKYGFEKLKAPVKSDDLAYVMFTSGTTGKPKGVMIEHRNVVNLILGLKERIYSKYNEKLKVSLVAHYGFDASVQQIFSALLQGHTLHIVPNNVKRDGEQLIEFCIDNEIDILDGTPTHIKLMLQNIDRSFYPRGLKHLIIGGEVLSKQVVEDFLSCFETSSPVITNIYGPTECCVDSISYDIIKENLKLLDNNVPIGKPLPNQKVYIFNNNTIQPIGVAGEICIGGKGVSRGYLKQEELNTEKFISNPFIKDERIYRTGDIGKWLSDGTIEYIGRKDTQIKIKGFRIELGEIEERLLKCENVKNAIVLPKEDEDGNKHLRAYVVLCNDIKLVELREYLLAYLPNYMIPSYFIKLEKVPLTSSGKVDIKELDTYGAPMETSKELVEPRDELEQIVFDIWQNCLGFKTASIYDNYFELGGDSFKGMMIINRYNELIGIKVPTSLIFNATTIAEHTKYIKDGIESQLELA